MAISVKTSRQALATTAISTAEAGKPKLGELFSSLIKWLGNAIVRLFGGLTRGLRRLLSARQRRSNPARSVPPSDLEDIASILRRFRVAERARTDALLEEPAEGVEHPAVEQDLRDWLQQTGRDRDAHRKALLDAAWDNLAAIDAEDPASLMTDESKRFEVVELADLLRDARQQLSRDGAIARQSAMALKVFRSDHQLTREAKDPLPPFLTLLLACLTILIEALINGQFLKDASAGGMLTGWIYAGGFALVNVTLSLASGYVFARKLTVRPRGWMTLIGTLGLAGWAGLSFYGHALFVAFREKAQADGDFSGALDTAPDLVHSNPLFWSQDPAAMMLLGIGVAISLISCLKGVFAFSDPHPGYLRLARQRDQTEIDFDETVDRLRDTIDDSLAEAETEIEDLAKGPAAALKQARELLAALRTMELEEDQDRDWQQNVLRTAMATYWAEQRKIRNGLSLLPTIADEAVNLPKGNTELPIKPLQLRLHAVVERLEEILGSCMDVTCKHRLSQSALKAHESLTSIIDEAMPMSRPPSPSGKVVNLKDSNERQAA